MNALGDWRTLGLPVLAVALAGIVGLELLQPFAQASTNPAPAVLIPNQPSHQPAPRAHIDIDAILARPLFTQSRRAPAAPAAPVEKVAAVETPRLTGVILSPSGGRAIFTLHEGKPVVVADGGRIGDDVVKSITSDTVFLTGPTGRRTLRITPDPEIRAKPHIVQAVNASPPPSGNSQTR